MARSKANWQGKKGIETHSVIVLAQSIRERMSKGTKRFGINRLLIHALKNAPLLLHCSHRSYIYD